MPWALMSTKCCKSWDTGRRPGSPQEIPIGFQGGQLDDFRRALASLGDWHRYQWPTTPSPTGIDASGHCSAGNVPGTVEAMGLNRMDAVLAPRTTCKEHPPCLKMTYVT